MPLPGTRVIPTGWEAAHQPTVAGTMTATCTITRRASATGAPTFNANTGRSVYPEPTTVYTGPCRLQALVRRSGLVDIGAEPVAPHIYQVTIPLDATPVQVDDQVEVTDATDSRADGTKLTVTDVRQGSLVWERLLLCIVHAPTTR